MLIVSLLESQASQVVFDAKFGDNFMVKLGSYPNTKLCSGWENSESFAYLSNIPSLKIEFINCIDSLGRKGRG